MEDGCAVAKDRIEQQDRDVKSFAGWPRQGRSGRVSCPTNDQKEVVTEVDRRAMLLNSVTYPAAQSHIISCLKCNRT